MKSILDGCYFQCGSFDIYLVIFLGIMMPIDTINAWVNFVSYWDNSLCCFGNRVDNGVMVAIQRKLIVLVAIVVGTCSSYCCNTVLCRVN